MKNSILSVEAPDVDVGDSDVVDDIDDLRAWTQRGPLPQQGGEEEDPEMADAENIDANLPPVQPAEAAADGETYVFCSWDGLLPVACVVDCSLA